jgi:hypothetical protein
MDVQELGVGSQKVNVPLQASKTSNFDHESKLPVESLQVGRVDGETQPTSTVNDIGPYTFRLPALENAYYIMNAMTVYCKAKIVRANGNDLTDDDVVAPVNYLGAVMWEHTEIFLNDRVLYPASSAYTNYKSYIETLLSYDDQARNGFLRAGLFALDMPGEFESTDVDDDPSNPGFKERYNMVRGSRTFDVCAGIPADFLRSENHLCPGNRLTIKLTRASDDFLLIRDAAAPTTYKLKILDVKLNWVAVRLSDKVPSPRIERYLMTRTELGVETIAQGLRRKNMILFTGDKMPKSVIIAMVDSAAFEGSQRRNPFNFKHYSTKSVMLKVNGQQVPSQPIVTDFTSNPPLISQAYMNLFLQTGCYRQDRGSLISLAAFQGGSFITAFDLHPDLCNGFHLHTSPKGQIDVSIEWDAALPNAVTILYHLTFDEVLMKQAGPAPAVLTETI